jgi:hypothetical protein
MKLIREQDDFNWINNDNNLDGVKIKTPVGKTVITIIDDGGRTVLLTWGEGGRYSSEYDRKTVESFIARGTWTLTESTDDFDWIRDHTVNPFMENDYVVVFIPKGTNLKYIEQLFDLVKSSGVETSNMSMTLQRVLHYTRTEEDTFIFTSRLTGFDEKRMFYGHGRRLFEAYKWDNVSDEVANKSKYDEYLISNIIKPNKLTESDDFDWIRDIEPGIELKPNTMYYFEPKLTVDEVERFANVISNSDYIKNWMLTKVISRMSGDRQGDNMSYFVTSDSIDELVVGWCLTSNPHSMSRSTYRDYDFVDARNEFNF